MQSSTKVLIGAGGLVALTAASYLLWSRRQAAKMALPPGVQPIQSLSPAQQQQVYNQIAQGGDPSFAPFDPAAMGPLTPGMLAAAGPAGGNTSTRPRANVPPPPGQATYKSMLVYDAKNLYASVPPGLPPDQDKLVRQAIWKRCILDGNNPAVCGPMPQ